MIVFILTHSGDRTNIKANFKLISTETLVTLLSSKNDAFNPSQIRYSYVDGNAVELLRTMKLDEFEKVFGTDHTILTEYIDRFFGAEVIKKYGNPPIKYKRMKVEKMERGRVYRTKDDGLIQWVGYATYIGYGNRKVFGYNQLHNGMEVKYFRHVYGSTVNVLEITDIIMPIEPNPSEFTLL